ncbi:MAG: class I SAM-dependent methyltransferase [Actinomycetota bacterium]|nr:class I SAM-dependent methyltransferase [Actinomycetota bacterium]
MSRLIELASNYVSVIRRFSNSERLRIVDFGSGVGVPGLLISYLEPTYSVTLVDSMKRRSAVAGSFVDLLGLVDRCDVVNGRVEELDTASNSFDIVVARCFARSSIFVELACPLLSVGGFILVTSPHDDYEVRWPVRGLRKFGFGPAELITEGVDNFGLIRKNSQSLVPRRSYSKIVKSPLW